MRHPKPRELAILWVLAAQLPSPRAAAAENDLESAVAVRSARNLVAAGRIPEAYREVHNAIGSNPLDPNLACVLGDIHFRKSEFEAAENAYRSVLEIDSRSARAHYGLGRIGQLKFLRETAKEHFAQAYRLNPLDPDIILAYADYTSGPEARSRLLRSFLNQSTDPIRRADVIARLQIEERSGIQAQGTLSTPYQPYKLKLKDYFATGSTPVGLALEVAIDGGKPVRLVVDTAGKGIVLTARSLRGIELKTLTQSKIEGMGADHARNGVVALARTVSIQDFGLVDCPLQVVDGPIAPGADGIIGTDIFQEFKLRLDASSRILELMPFGPGESAREPPNAYHVAEKLLLAATLDRHRAGYFLLDTGSAFSMISTTIMNGSIRPSNLTGSQGVIAGASRLSPVSLSFEGNEYTDPDPIAVDVGQMSQQQGIEISGAIGFNLLRSLVVSINYRDGIVRVESKRKARR
jgi:hypothetical protein